MWKLLRLGLFFGFLILLTAVSVARSIDFADERKLKITGIVVASGIAVPVAVILVVFLLGGISTLVALHFANLLSKALFNDAFSGMYHMKRVSLAVSVEKKHKITSFYDSRGRKVISRWDYPYVLEAAVPMILQDLDSRRMELLKRLSEHPGPRECSEQGESSEQGEHNLNGLLEHEENLKWMEAFGKDDCKGIWKENWKVLFEREKAFRWYVLSGMELTQELIKLEKLKLEVRRLELERLEKAEPRIEPEQRNEPELRNGSEQRNEDEPRSETEELEQRNKAKQRKKFNQHKEPSWPLKHDFLKYLKAKREKQMKELKLLELEQVKHLESRLRLKQRLDVESQQVEVSKCEHEARTAAPRTANGPRGRTINPRYEAESRLRHQRLLLQQRQEVLLQPADEEWLREQLEQLRMHKLQALMQTERYELPHELQDDQLTITKVIRNMRLEVVFLPSYPCKCMSYFITATGSQENYLSKLYLEEFSGFCEIDQAAEFLKLIEILNGDTFVVKRQPKNPLLLDVNGRYTLGEQDKLFSCERLEDIVTAILKDGKMLEAVHVKGVSYV